MKPLLVTALLASGIFLTTQAQAAGIPCTAWVDAQHGNGDIDQVIEQNSLFSWVDGYLTARVPHWQTPESYPASMMQEWLTKFCSLHPKADMTEAAIAFVRTHTAEQIAAGD